MAMSAVQAATKEIIMPALSSTMTEGKIVQWLKEVGDEVQVGDAVMVVESDKADMDVESFEAGFLAAILTPEGEAAPVGAAVAVLAESKDGIAAAAAAAASGGGGAAAAAPAPAAAEAPAAGGGGASGVPDGVEYVEIAMPALSSTMTEGKIVQWLKAPGDKVESGDALLVIESDKADMDYECFEEGYLARILVEEGASAAVGSAFAIIVKSEADIAKTWSRTRRSAAPPPPPPPRPPPPPPPAAAAAPAPAAPLNDGRVVASGHAKKLASDMGVDLRAVAGSGPGGRIVASDVEAAKGGGGSAAAAAPAWTPAPGVVAATPRAKALAKSKGIDVTTLKGTGNFGRVTEADVMAAAGIAPKKAAAPAPAAVAASSGREIPTLPDGPKAMDGMQKAVAKNMEAGMDVPVFRVSRRIRTDAFDDLYRQLKPRGVTVSALLAKAAALALEAHPIVNAAYAPGQIVYKGEINIAMAVAIDGGLMTPTLKRANEMSILALSAAWKDLVGKAKAKSLKPDEYNSGTFYISNLGMFGVSDFGALLPSGAGSILAIGGALPTVVQRADGTFGTVKEMTVTITCDHRHIYGADAAEFLRTFADLLENNCAQLLL
ncbi:2-oxoacid dehydrogenases acyltransferase-domain-containing protein [Tribonema minus]|uniref:Dihydrolipoamide acetyltransferase component of pyruvate dehydrogenase complex n=1 Tax=Tribonema minus TaxID=303371 RepID=A0A836C7H2_9STRA|nr:2-oxoacid dehydrogenases acyltransferase-domain-containing protein [Tribonema minus]